ncbi:uncharacterized protein il17rc [Paralichthys olivaceus]|uniref:uncharacterized protein il17rc n=1 Tax=Paralichthys olivaceus TaxID=8255 RepID=UPI00375090CC
MFLPGWLIWWVLLTLSPSACSFEISGYESDEIICSQGLSDCTMKDEIINLDKNYGVDVQNLTANFKLCSDTNELCSLCLVIDTELHIRLDNGTEDKGHSGQSEEARKRLEPTVDDYFIHQGSLTVCYHIASTMPICKKVEFSVNRTAVTQQNRAKVSMVITKPAGVSFSSKVFVYLDSGLPPQTVDAPSLEKVCSMELKKCVKECQVPKFSILKEKNHVELQFGGRDNGRPSVCIQHEQNGVCQSWNRKTIPLHSVTHCMCLQTWYDQNLMRSQRCPFTNMDFSQRNVWQNVSVSVGQGQTNQHGTLLLWNLSAPCRLEGEVWPCRKEDSCREMRGLRQQLANKPWRQNSKGLWEKTGSFEDIDLQLFPCVMVKVKGMGHELGPFCFKDTDRWRWSLLVVFVMLLVCLSMLVFYILHGFVKKWVWSWHHGGFVKIGREGHVLLLSPPDVDDGVSESVCRLGSLLCIQGFSVSVDQWSRKEQCTLGPLPWLHSQLLQQNTKGDRVVVVLTQKALERTEEWSHYHKRVITAKKMADEGLPQIWSPYSDVFTASLCLIQADKQQGRAGERFLLVKFDSSPSSNRNLPELLQGLPLFQLPAQNQALLTELRLGRTRRRSGGKTRTGWKWNRSDGWRTKTKEGSDQQKTSLCKYIGVDKTWSQHP